MLSSRVSLLIVGGALFAAGCAAPPPASWPARGDDPAPRPERPERPEVKEDADAVLLPPPSDAVRREPPFGPLELSWTQETGDWNGGLLLTKEGDLLSFAGRGVRVHARDDGRVLHTATACSPVSEDAVAWSADGARFLLVCSDEVRSFSWPKLGSERLAKLAARVDQAAIGGGVVAVAEDGFFAADRKGMLRVLDAKSGRELDAWLPPAEVQSLAVSPDGAQVIVATDDEVFVRDVRARATRPLRKARLAKGFAFSPDGAALFGRFESFSASVVDPTTAAPRGGAWRVGSWITAARWIADGRVVATGSDGLALFAPDGKKTDSPIPDLGEGLAASPDGGVVCAGGRGGRIACFGRKKPEPTTIAAAFPKASADAGRQPGGAGGASAGSDGAAAPAGPAIDGTIVTKQGKKLVVQVDPAQAIEVGSTGEVSRPFSQAFSQDSGFGVMSGWLVIAEVRVAAVDKGKVTLDVVTEKSAMTVNGRPSNHFTPGAVRLSLSPPP